MTDKTNAQAVDVLADLSAVIAGVVDAPIRERRGYRNTLVEARAAVAELIEAAAEMRAYPGSSGTCVRLDAALARVGGAA
jgi:hypothetical protein